MIQLSFTDQFYSKISDLESWSPREFAEPSNLNDWNLAGLQAMQESFLGTHKHLPEQRSFIICAFLK